MKELSIEEKAKRYDEALKKAKDMLSYKEVRREDMEYLFPELKESEDEKTKRVLHSIANKMSQHLRDIFTEEEFQCFDAWSNAYLEKQGEQKPACSEEDEKMIDAALQFAHEYGRHGLWCWLKSLKDRVQPQNTWKPSDEQMDALHDAAVYVDKSMFPYPKGILMKLYKQIKKLKE